MLVRTVTGRCREAAELHQVNMETCMWRDFLQKVSAAVLKAHIKAAPASVRLPAAMIPPRAQQQPEPAPLVAVETGGRKLLSQRHTDGLKRCVTDELNEAESTGF